MPTQYSELVGRRAKLTVSADWVGAGWLTLRINPLLPRRELYLALLFDGLSNYYARVEIILSHQEQTIWKASGLCFDHQGRLSYSGSSTDWKGTDSPGADYKRVHYDTGLPAWSINSAPNSQFWPDTAIPDNSLVWYAATNNGYDTAVHQVCALPLPVTAQADTYAFRFTDRAIGFTAPTPSVEVFLACRSRAI